MSDTEKCPNPGCNSIVKSQRRRGICVMTYPPANWRWVMKDGDILSDEIECSHWWHDSPEPQKPAPRCQTAQEWLDSSITPAFMAEISGELPRSLKVHKQSAVLLMMESYANYKALWAVANASAPSAQPSASTEKQ